MSAAGNERKMTNRILLVVLCIALAACAPTRASTDLPKETIDSVAPTNDVAPATATEAPTAPTSTVDLFSARIVVDSFEQEVYPFVVDGDCSLGEAIKAANTALPVDGCAAGAPGGILGGAALTVIQLESGTYALTLPDESPLPIGFQGVDWGPSGLPSIIASVVIEGNGAVIERRGETSFRLLFVLPADFGPKPEVTLTNLTLSGGDAGSHLGGGLYLNLVIANLDRVSVTGNQAISGAGIYSSSSTLKISNSVIADNHSPAIETAGLGGGLYSQDSSVEISSTQITNNSAFNRGGGIMNGSGTMMITESILANNTAKVGGGLHTHHQVDANMEPLPNENPSTSISGSCIIGNIATHVSNTSSGSGVYDEASAKNNWWGDPSGPGGAGPGLGDEVTANVFYDPFLIEIPEFCSIALP